MRSKLPPASGEPGPAAPAEEEKEKQLPLFPGQTPSALADSGDLPPESLSSPPGRRRRRTSSVHHAVQPPSAHKSPSVSDESAKRDRPVTEAQLYAPSVSARVSAKSTAGTMGDTFTAGGFAESMPPKRSEPSALSTPRALAGQALELVSLELKAFGDARVPPSTAVTLLIASLVMIAVVSLAAAYHIFGAPSAPSHRNDVVPPTKGVSDEAFLQRQSPPFPEGGGDTAAPAASSPAHMVPHIQGLGPPSHADGHGVTGPRHSQLSGAGDAFSRLSSKSPWASGTGRTNLRPPPALCQELVVPKGAECVLAIPTLSKILESRPRPTSDGDLATGSVTLAAGDVVSTEVTDTEGRALLFVRLERVIDSGTDPDGFVCEMVSLLPARGKESERAHLAPLAVAKMSLPRCAGFRARSSLLLPPSQGSAVCANLMEESSTPGGTGATLGSAPPPAVVRQRNSSGLPSYVLSSVVSGDHEPWQIHFYGDSAQKSLYVIDDKSQLLATVEPGGDGLTFNKAAAQGYYLVRVGPRVDAGLIICSLFALDRMTAERASGPPAPSPVKPVPPRAS